MSNALKRALEAKNLTEQEIQISELIAKGLSNKEVANQLFLEEADVKKMLPPIYAKVEVKSRAQLIVYCLPFLSFQMNLNHIREDITLKIEHFRDKLQLMENLFGGVFIDIDENRREVQLVGTDNVDLKVLFKVDNFEENIPLEEVQELLKDKVIESNFTILSKAEFKQNLGI